MLTDERIIEIIAARCDEECGWSTASAVFNHNSWVDCITYLFLEKGLRNALLDAYKTEIVNAWEAELLENEERESMRSAYAEWRADSSCRMEEER